LKYSTFAELSSMESKVEMAFRHVVQGRRIVARQRQLVEWLALNGRDTTSAEQILDSFVRTLAIFEDDLTRLSAQESKRDTSER
jgi:hypothetical protein